MPLVLGSILVAVLIGGLHVSHSDLEAEILRTFEHQQQTIKEGSPEEEVLKTVRGELRGQMARHATSIWILMGGLVTLVLLTGLVTVRGIKARSRLIEEHKHAAEMLEAQQSLAISEDKYRTLFIALAEGLALHEIICDEAGKPCDYRFLEVNPAYERLTGLTKEEIVGKTALEVLPETDRQWIGTYGTVALQGKSARFDNYSKELGKYFQVIVFSPAPGRFATLLVDTTDHQKAQEALVHERNLLHSLMDNVPDHIYFKDRQGRFTRINKALAVAFGLNDPSEAVGKTDFDFFTKEHASEALEDEKNVMATGRPVPAKEEKETWPDGRETWVSTTKVALPDSDGKIIGTFGISRDVTERKRAEEELARERHLMVTLMNNTPDHVYFKDSQSRFIRMSKAQATRFGLDDPSEAIGKTDFDFFGLEHAEQAFADEQEVMRTGKPLVGMEEKENWPDGHETWVSTTKVPLRSTDGSVTGTFGISRDITKRKEVEDQLRQAQKMQAVGELAGGVAHDFNNQLTIVKGYADLMLNRLPDDEDLRSAMQEIRDASDRATKLTTQLLAFSRKQVLNPEVIDIGGVLADMSNSLSQMIGEDIRLSIVPDTALGNIRADRLQVEQAIMNIVINARDSMSSGGQVTLETTNIEFTDTLVDTRPDVLPGRYVMLAITDTGCGMDGETLEHVFEPFFTTKPAGEGTGLGLAMVYGFVKQSGGTVHAYSEVGKGTTFKIYLPRVDEPVEEVAPKTQPSSQFGPAGTETILVAEDNDAVRQLVVRVLRECGYTVLATSNGEEAMPLGRDYEDRIHLLITDVVMPGMNGPELAVHLTNCRNDMHVLYMSGYTGDAIVDRGVVDSAARVLSKPFTPEMLARTVRKILDEDKE